MSPRRLSFYPIARHLEEHGVQGLLMIGGWAGYETAHMLYKERQNYPAFQHPHLPARSHRQQPRLGPEHRVRYRPE